MSGRLGLLRALARTAGGIPSFPDYEKALTSSSLVIVPALVLAEVDYFLLDKRDAMRKLVAEMFDPGTRYEYEPPAPRDIVRARCQIQGPWLGIGRWDGGRHCGAPSGLSRPGHGSARLQRNPRGSSSDKRARADTLTTRIRNTLLRAPSYCIPALWTGTRLGWPSSSSNSADSRTAASASPPKRSALYAEVNCSTNMPVSEGGSEHANS
jgi:hypothetical protein